MPACSDDPEPVTLAIRGDRAVLLAARQGSDAWQRLTADATGKTSFTVDGPFELVGACEDFGGEVYAYAGGPADADAGEPYKFDVGCGIAADATVTITTASVTPLTVFLGFGRLDVTADQSGGVVVNPGRHDIAILDEATGMLAIRRDVELTDGVTIDVDLTGAAALVARPVTTSPAGADVSSWSYTANDTRIRYGSGGWTMPASLAAAGDRHFIAARETDEQLPRNRYRTAHVEAGSSAPLTIALPAHLASATLTWTPTPSATFDAAGEWDEISMFGFQANENLAPLWFVLSYPHAARTAGALAAPAGVTGIAGWKAEWNPFAGPAYLDLSLSRETSDGSEGVGWSVDPNEKAGVRAAAARAAQQAPTAKARRLAEMRP